VVPKTDFKTFRKVKSTKKQPRVSVARAFGQENMTFDVSDDSDVVEVRPSKRVSVKKSRKRPLPSPSAPPRRKPRKERIEIDFSDDDDFVAAPAWKSKRKRRRS
jgi:hypothetical protein